MDPKITKLDPKRMQKFEMFSNVAGNFFTNFTECRQMLYFFPYKMSEFFMFYEKELAACINAFCMFCVYVSPGFA